MPRLAAEAVAAGAFGFSTSRTIAHKSISGDYTPTLRAHEAELAGIAAGLGDAGAGFVEIVSDWRDARAEMSMLCRIGEASGRPILYSLIQWHDPARSGVWRQLIEESDAAIRDGVSIRGVFAPRAIGSLLGLEGSQNPFSGTPTYKSIAHLSLAERVARMRDPAVRARILSEDPIAGSTFPLIRFLTHDQMFRFGDQPNYLPRREDSAAAVAARTGRTAPEVVYDWLLEDDGRAFVYTPLVNYADFNLAPAEAMLANRNTIMGLGDGGAHVGFILDAGFPTWLLTYWGRERGAYPVEELIRRLTSDPAEAAGLQDRGVLAVGKKADINVIDHDKLTFGRPYVAFDLPAGGRRLLQKATGYAATIVSGIVTYRDGAATGALPGRLVRSERTGTRMAAE
jgi:N-acyl-D-aspartate/D-glutamate deacylase